MLNRHDPRALAASHGHGLSPQMHETLPALPHHGGFPPMVDEDEGGFDPLRLLYYVVKYRWFIAAAATLGIVLGLLTAWLQTPMYRATAQLEIMVPQAKVFQDLEIAVDSNSITALQTSAEKLRSRALAQRVVFELGLADKADFLFPRPNFSLANLFSRAVGATPSSDPGQFTPEEREAMAIGRVVEQTQVQPVTGTTILAIRYVNQDPKYAELIANQLTQSYIDQRVDQTSQTSTLAREFIQEQVQQAKEKLATSEKSLVEYAKQQGITVTGDETSLIGSNMESINKALSDAIQKRLELARLVQQIDAGDGRNLPDVINSEAIGKLSGQLIELKSEYQQKLATFKPGFPEMRKLAAQISEMERQVTGAIRGITSSIKLKYDAAVSAEADLRVKLTELEAEQAAYQDKKIQYTILKREVDSNRSQYESLIGKLNEVGVSSELKSPNANIVDAAVIPDMPYAPRMLINLGGGIIGMLLAAALAIYLLELLNNSFSNPDQIESELKLPVLGIIPRIDAALAEQLSEPKSHLSEAYRSLRTALQFTGVEGAPRSLLVTSAEPSEGKSTTAFKLAQDFAALGNRVLLIDADLRKPNIHRMFGYDNTIGLSNVLTSTVRREDSNRILRPTKYKNLTVMTAGTVPPNPADLLSSTRLSILISSCAMKYDMIIIDAPPIIGLSDAPILSRLAEKTLLTVSANQVSRKSAVAALKRLSIAGASIAGAVLSKFSTDKFDYNYSYKYMSYDYYTYGEGQPARLENRGGASPLKASLRGVRGVIERLRRTVG